MISFKKMTSPHILLVILDETDSNAPVQLLYGTQFFKVLIAEISPPPPAPELKLKFILPPRKQLILEAWVVVVNAGPSNVMPVGATAPADITPGSCQVLLESGWDQVAFAQRGFWLAIGSAAAGTLCYATKVKLQAPPPFSMAVVLWLHLLCCSRMPKIPMGWERLEIPGLACWTKIWVTKFDLPTLASWLWA